jgi:putative tricarboxylic transport membrane protein
LERYRNNPNALMVGGLVMLGSSMQDEAAVTLRDVSPIARLTGDWEVIAVPADSAIRTVADMREVMLTKPGSLRWAGGALGGPDQGVVWGIASALGVSLDDVPYFGKPGGHRVGEAVARGIYPIGVSGYAELEPFIRQGKLRVLAVVAPQRLAGIAAPTLRESGIDVSIMNWRGVFAAPGLDQVQQDRLVHMVEMMRRSSRWQSELTRERWSDTWLAGDQFTQFLNREQIRWSGVVNPPASAEAENLPLLVRVRPLVWLQTILAVIIVATTYLGIRLRMQRLTAEAQAAELERQRAEISKHIERMKASTVNLIREGVDEDFGDWNLSSAERDIAWFMLRGLPLKQIAIVRGTSERTVRQQAQAIYRKADLDGRSDLAGRVLERFI